jgi:N-acetylglucosaminyldiphosphoundecaprenol N-acetyl-beta-D-mannosaminyltransferase
MFIADSTEKTNSANPAGIADVPFDLIDAPSVLEKICGWRDSGRRAYISLVNPHAVMLCHRDREMKEAIQKSALVLPDGIGIILGAALLSYPHCRRLSGPELMLYLCDQGRLRGLTHYFYGGEEGVAERLIENLSGRYPGLKVVGHCCPPFRMLSDAEDTALVDGINACRPDILWVCLGAPKQEKWMASHAERIEATAMIGIGAAFDFHSGNKPWCPEPLRNVGLEWAFRLACEPRRLWRRNLDSFLFLGLAAGQLLAARRQRRTNVKKLPAERRRPPDSRVQREDSTFTPGATQQIPP